jgi:hypothetical protein
LVLGCQILDCGSYGRPYFIDDRELRWANPAMREPLPQLLRAALTYPRALLSSTNPEHWAKLKRTINSTPLWDLPIAPRWRQILEEDWTNIPNTHSPIAIYRATLQSSATGAFTGTPHNPTGGQLAQRTKITLHFPAPRQRKADKRKADLKRKLRTTIEPLRGSDANGETTSISLALARCTTRRIKHNRRSTYVEEFLVKWDPVDCTLQEAQQQQLRGFVITSVISLDERVLTTLLETATATKRPKGRPRAADRPPLT